MDERQEASLQGIEGSSLEEIRNTTLLQTKPLGARMKRMSSTTIMLKVKDSVS
jgi:hypothetical protein